MQHCLICGAAHIACGGPSPSIPVDREVTDMVVSMPRKGIVNTEAPDMVRVQLKPNDVRSYRRRDAEELLESGTYPDAFIVGEEPEAEQEPAKARREAPDKARRPATTSAPASTPVAPPAQTKSEPPAAPPAEPKSE